MSDEQKFAERMKIILWVLFFAALLFILPAQIASDTPTASPWVFADAAIIYLLYTLLTLGKKQD